MNSVPVADPLCPSALHGELCSNLEAAKTVPGGPLQTDAHHTRSQCTFRDTLARHRSDHGTRSTEQTSREHLQ